MVKSGMGNIHRRTDRKYFVYLPVALAEDTSFPFNLKDGMVKVKVKFDKNKIVVEKI